MPRKPADTIEAEPQAPSADMGGMRLPLTAVAQRRRVPVARPDSPVVCEGVFAEVDTGPRGKVDLLFLHEVPLLRRKLSAQNPGGDSPRVFPGFPEAVERIRPFTAERMIEEYARLEGRYVFDKPGGREGEQLDLLTDFYGSRHNNRLAEVMRILAAGWRQISADLIDEVETISEEQIDELLRLVDPYWKDQPGNGRIEFESFEPSGRGAVVGG